jgi:prepilin-type N-terminal cleavage/methylation domain-containing protein
MSIRRAGFTLMELLIAMAIFSFLGLAIVYLMRQGMNVFVVGTTDSAVQDRADTVLPKVRRDLLALYAGDRFDPPAPPPDEKLLLEHRLQAPPPPPPTDVRVRAGNVRLRNAPDGPLKDAECPFFSFVIATADEWRDPLLRRDPVPGAAAKEFTSATVNSETGADQAYQPAGGLMEVCWIAVPEDARDPAILTLRRGFRAPIGGEGTLLDPANLDTMEELDKRCPVEERGVLHFSATWRNAFATSWDPGPGGGIAETDPYVGAVWDSTRALEKTFRFFRGPDSLGDPSDDRFPVAVRLEVTLASTSQRGWAPETFLRENVDATGTRIKVMDPNPLVATRAQTQSDERWLKIEGEWMRYRLSAANPDLLTGELVVERGKRGTKAASHSANARVYVGLGYHQEVRLRMSRDAFAKRPGGGRGK